MNIETLHSLKLMECFSFVFFRNVLMTMVWLAHAFTIRGCGFCIQFSPFTWICIPNIWSCLPNGRVCVLFENWGWFQHAVLPTLSSMWDETDQVNAPINVNMCMWTYSCRMAFVKNTSYNFKDEHNFLYNYWYLSNHCLYIKWSKWT